jgi:predicted transcriptional regulator of viral defense system
MASARQYLQDLQSRGRYHFSTEEAAEVLGASLSATQAALRRLKAKGEIADPHRGFHIIVPPEYRRLGCVPADQFIPQLMNHLGEPYYVALLSAAAYHGAAHQKPQVFQVMVGQRRRSIRCGEIHVQFVSRRDMSETPVVERNTSRGTIRIASPAATAHELVGYPEHAGGLNNVATVLAELAESIDAESLVAEARREPLAWVQRLGYLLTLVDSSDLADALEPVIHERAPFPVALAPSAPVAGSRRDARWKVSINFDVEPDL